MHYSNEHLDVMIKKNVFLTVDVWVWKLWWYQDVTNTKIVLSQNSRLRKQDQEKIRFSLFLLEESLSG